MVIYKTPIDYLPPNSKLVFLKEGKIIKYDNTMCRFGIYKCICGNLTEVSINNAKRGKVISCGCYKKDCTTKYNYKHGLKKHPLFNIWMDIKTRCYNNHRDNWKYYGSKGVKMCDEWLNDFKSFYDWAMKNNWQYGMQIDKDIIPKKLGIDAILYSPQYCSIVTVSENCHSRSSNHPLTYKGITKNLTQWEKDLNFPKDLIYKRLKSGWAIDKAIETPILKGKNKK